MQFLRDTLHLLQRHMTTTLRIPIWVAVTLLQPVIWLVLYGQVFQSVAEIPGFSDDSYLQFLTPGVVMMTALFGSSWTGLGIIHDLQEGVIDRMLATPVWRSAIITARVLHASLNVIVQTAIAVVVAVLLGVHFPGGLLGIVVIIFLSGLLGAGIAALSNAIALLTRRQEALHAIINLLGLPLTFLSTAFMASTLLPNWIRTAAAYNPVNWGINGARAAMFGEWGGAFVSALFLALFAGACSLFALFAFRIYQRSA